MSDNILKSNITLLKLHATADILGGEVFFTTPKGLDPENLDNSGNPVQVSLTPNCLYIRLKGSDGSIAYISGYKLNQVVNTLESDINKKADKSLVESIQIELENKVSKQDITELETKVEELANKDLSGIETELNSKATKNDLYALENKVNNNNDYIATLKKKLETKADAVSLAEIQKTIVDNQPDIDKIDNILKDINELKSNIGTLTGVDTGSINSLQSQIDILKNRISNLISIDVLNDLKSNLEGTIIHRDEDLSQRIDNVEAKINQKASTVYVQNELIEINNSVIELSNTIDSKANKYDVSLKANKSDVDVLTKKLNSLNIKVSDIESNTSNYDELVDKIDTKADKSFVETNLVTIKNDLQDIPTKSAFIASNSNLEYKISTLENKHNNDYLRLDNEIDSKYCELENDIENLQININTLDTAIDKNSADISNIQNTVNNNTEQLKYPSIRILSTREYNRLTRVPSYVDYYSPYYIYPNILYFVVDFNKPKAIYIGDILIAKADIKGSIGFAYTFPISF